ncbi:MAG: electron transport complex subunit E [Pseudomonadota bacterium]
MNRTGALNLSGLWQNNPALVQLLGLCPLLAVSNSAINALALGLATIVTLFLSNTLVAATRPWLISEIRIPVYVLLIAGVVTCVSLLMNAYAHDIYLQLGIFIPLIITNCMILARAEAYASRNRVTAAAADALIHGVGFAVVLLVMGAIRELAGSGSLFANSHLLFGESFSPEPLIQLSIERGLLIAILPPGAFLLLGLLIAAKNRLETLTVNTAAKHKAMAKQ